MYCTPMISPRPLCPFLSLLLSALRLCVYVLCVPGIESVDVYLISCVHYRGEKSSKSFKAKVLFPLPEIPTIKLVLASDGGGGKLSFKHCSPFPPSSSFASASAFASSSSSSPLSSLSRFPRFSPSPLAWRLLRSSPSSCCFSRLSPCLIRVLSNPVIYIKKHILNIFNICNKEKILLGQKNRSHHFPFLLFLFLHLFPL
jgi:hypothetical protein